eukprot:1185507-Prorocentrum_minimum.AAC.1
MSSSFHLRWTVCHGSGGSSDRLLLHSPDGVLYPPVLRQPGLLHPLHFVGTWVTQPTIYLSNIQISYVCNEAPIQSSHAILTYSVGSVSLPPLTIGLVRPPIVSPYPYTGYYGPNYVSLGSEILEPYGTEVYVPASSYPDASTLWEYMERFLQARIMLLLSAPTKETTSRAYTPSDAVRAGVPFNPAHPSSGGNIPGTPPYIPLPPVAYPPGYNYNNPDNPTGGPAPPPGSNPNNPQIPNQNPYAPPPGSNPQYPQQPSPQYPQPNP